MLFAEAVLAEAARLAQEEATAEETLRAEADAIVAGAVAAEALFDDYASLAADGDITEALDVEALRQSTSTTPMTPTRMTTRWSPTRPWKRYSTGGPR